MEQPKLDWAKQWLSQPKGFYIGGEWVTGKEAIPTVNPYNCQTLTELSESSPSDVNHAVESAAHAFAQGTWRNMNRRERASVLRKIGNLVRTHREELATLESLDNGKTFQESLYDDMPDSSDIFDYYAGWTDKLYGETSPVEPGFLNFTERNPIGVCALIVPWNFPLLLAMWKLAPALSMGNTVVIKPSSYTSLSLIRLFELIHEAKLLPPGVINLVLGDAIPGEALARHEKVNKISFTGSTAVGKKIVEYSGQSNLKSVTLELGGKSPDIIFEDAPNVEEALVRSFNVMFGHKGEKCTEPTRFLIHESLYSDFAKKIAPMADAIKCGDPFNPETQQGPQCHQAHYEKVMGYLELGKKEGATLLAGGDRRHRR